jgi:hypothetical protein
VHRIAVLDDHQSVAPTYADWSQVREPLEFADHRADEDALAARLEPFDIVVAFLGGEPIRVIT